MVLTDPEAIKALKRARIYELETMLADYPESDIDGRTDWEMIANEAGWLLDAFNSCDTVHHDDLMEHRSSLARIRRQYRQGYSIPLSAYMQMERDRDAINEYNRLVNFVKKLKARGLYCPYC